MDPVIIILLAVFIGIPLLSIVVMGVFALTAKYRFVEIRVRGGTMRGAIASALARVVVKDTATVQLPLEVELEKRGFSGFSTPLFGGASVQDIEIWVYMDDEHVSTVTEARTTRIKSRQDRLVLPVNVDVHLPRGVIRAVRDYRSMKRRAAEVKVAVRGHVIVRHWFINRRIPVRFAKHVVVGDPLPRLTSVRWRAVSTEGDAWRRAQVSVRLDNAYRDEGLEGKVRFELRRRRRLLPDVLMAIHEEFKLRLESRDHRTFRLEASLEPVDTLALPGRQDASVGSAAEPIEPATGADPNGEAVGPSLSAIGSDEVPDGPGGHLVSVALRVYWNDQELTPEEVRVLGVPGARHGPLLATGLDGDGRGRKEAIAKLNPMQGSR